jgi:hypothetical protein
METISENKRLTVITFTSLHAFELKKHIDWILNHEKKGLRPNMKVLFQNAKVNLDRLISEFGKVIDMREHEDLSIIIDDFHRLIMANPDKGELIMNELRELIEKHEK